MEIAHLEHLTRSLATLFSRRTLAGALGLSALEYPGLIEAKKKRKKRKKKKPNPPTCSELCGVGCTNCFFRADAPPLCGGDGGLVGVELPCASDNDCVGEDEPYCVARIEKRESGETLDVCEELGCAAGELGVCTGMGACNP